MNTFFEYMTSGYGRTIRAVIAAVLVVMGLSVDNQLVRVLMVALGILMFACDLLNINFIAALFGLPWHGHIPDHPEK